MSTDPQAAWKQQAAEAAAALVEDGMVVGLGTGSTAKFVIAKLIAQHRDGMRITAVPTSNASEAQAREGGIPIVDLTEAGQVDLTIDGADAVSEGALDLVKGLGGALLREKIVAAASRRLVIVADGTKLVDRLGSTTPVPVEVIPFAWQATAGQLAALGVEPVLRQGADGPFLTDGGHYILDCRTGPIADPAALDARLQAVVGVVETGLFVGRAHSVFIAGPGGTRRLDR